MTDNSFYKILSLEDYLNSENKDTFIYVNLIRESNAIEGIFPEGRTYSGNQIIHEIIDHEIAYKYVIEQHSKLIHNPLGEVAKILHNMLMQNISIQEVKRENNPNNIAGEYRRNKSYIVSKTYSNDGLKEKYEFKGRLYHTQISKAITMLEEKLSSLNKNTTDINSLLELHYDFETIHPFYDGNGRTGRLLLNLWSLNSLGQFIVIDSSHKTPYYDAIAKRELEFRTEHPELKFYKDKAVERINPFYQYLQLPKLTS